MPLTSVKNDSRKWRENRELRLAVLHPERTTVPHKELLLRALLTGGGSSAIRFSLPSRTSRLRPGRDGGAAMSLEIMGRIHRANSEVQFAALSVATEGAAAGEVPGSCRMFPAASVS